MTFITYGLGNQGGEQNISKIQIVESLEVSIQDESISGVIFEDIMSPSIQDVSIEEIIADIGIESRVVTNDIDVDYT